MYEQIIAIYPELTIEDFYPETGSIYLKDDSDGQGAYIAKWYYSNPINDGMKLGKSVIFH